MTAIQDTELLAKFSIKTGSAGNSTASAASTSLGKYISTTTYTGGSLNDLFDDISGAENAASTVDYRCLFLRNTNASNDWTSVKAWVAAQVTGGADITIAIDNAAASLIGSSSAQAESIANETTAPSAVGAFSAPTDYASGLSVGTIPPGYCRAIWIKRTATNSVALTGDGFTLGSQGDTGSL